MSRLLLPLLPLLLAASPAVLAAHEDPPAPKPDDAQGDEAQEPEKPFALMVGDPAPALHADQWLAGEPVALERGKVYVVHFWAVWSPPSLLELPRLTALQETHREAGLVVVGLTKEDERGSRIFAVEELVKERADEIGFSLAWDRAGVSHERYLTASGYSKIPNAYIVDRDGRIAYMGHPNAMDETLEKVLAGEFDTDAAAREYAEKLRKVLAKRAIEQRLNAAYGEGRYGDVLLAFDELIALGPEYRNYAVNKFHLMMREMKDPEGAYRWALEAAATCIAEDSFALNALAYSVVVMNDIEPKNYDVALRLARRANELEEEKDGQIWNTIGAILHAQGDLVGAVDAMEKASERAPHENQRIAYRRTLVQYQKDLKDKGDGKGGE